MNLSDLIKAIYDEIPQAHSCSSTPVFGSLDGNSFEIESIEIDDEESVVRIHLDTLSPCRDDR